ncbi:PaaX family transcriptional regulator [Mariniluteicoccus flavus]
MTTAHAIDERTETLPRHQQLIVTIFGLYARQHGGVVAVAELITLLGDLGAEGSAVRSSVSRLKKRGALESVRVGGVAAYALSDALKRVFVEGDSRIFSADRATLDDPWLLAAFTVPESQRHLRHKIRSLFTRRGFGSVTPGLWIAPGRLHASISAELAEAGLADYVDFFSADFLGDEIAAKVDQWWDLEELGALYGDFLARTEPVAARWAEAEPTPREAFRDYIPLVTQWRRLPYLDPGLPVDVLPDPWPGQHAADLFFGLHKRLAPLAADHAESVLQLQV